MTQVHTDQRAGNSSDPGEGGNKRDHGASKSRHSFLHRLKRPITKAAISGGAVCGLISFALNAGLQAHIRAEDRQHEVSKILWEKRQSAYAELLAISSLAVISPQDAKDYAELHRRLLVASGPLEVYQTGEVADCVTVLRDMLFACAHPEAKSRQTCDVGHLLRLHSRLGYEVRKSIQHSWDESLEDFLQDRSSKKRCDVT